MVIDYNDFNPRSREGSDDMLASGAIVENISIHAPARGATLDYGRRLF